MRLVHVKEEKIFFTMTTGDLKNNLRKFVSELKQVHFPQSELDLKGIAQGVPKAFLPVVHHVFLDYSISLAQYFANKEYDLYGKTDLRFMEAVYKVLRDEFGYKPQITKEQFLTIGFAERKILSLCEILKLLRGKHDELNPKTKSERKRGRNISHLTSKGTTEKESSSVIKDVMARDDYFPGPLPVNTDMKRFQSNKEATEAGLGLTEPLVTRVIPDEDHTIMNSEDATRCCSKTAGKDDSHQSSGTVPSNLVVKSVSDERYFGVKFPVSRNLEIRSNFCQQPQLNWITGHSQGKSVTSEDQFRESQPWQTKTAEALPLEVPLSCEPNPSISIPATIHTIPYSERSGLSYPMDLDTTVNVRTRPQSIPSPVSMTTAPTPSPDLMLTPVIKGVHHSTVPILSCQRESDLQAYKVPVVEDNLPATKVVRHSNSSEAVSSVAVSAHPSSSAENVTQVVVLKQLVQELQEKFDAMTLLNNEMSARVVLLESRMKLLEEACEKKPCCSCNNHPPTSKESTLQKDIVAVVSGFNLHGDKNLATNALTNEEINNHTGNHKTGLKQNTTSRKLFKEIVTSAGSGDNAVLESSHDNTPSTSDKSDNDHDDDDDDKENKINCEETPSKSKTVSSSEQDDVIVISPLPSASKLSEVFADSTTKNTVVNVHKRLQETRELLARTNRDFAAKFNHFQLE